MIKIEQFDPTPMGVDESRDLVLSGDAPFVVRAGCFVDDPPPAGFRPCPACGSKHIIHAYEPLRLSPGRAFRNARAGTFTIDITDAVGDTHHIEVAVAPRNDQTPGTMTMGA